MLFNVLFVWKFQTIFIDHGDAISK